MERWKPIPGFEDCYEISDFGNIRSKDRWVTYRNGCKRFIPGKYMLINAATRKYKTVCLHKECRMERWSIHRLVAICFIPNPKNLPYVDHINADPSNNHYSNLRWVTQKENMNNPITKKRHRERVYTEDRNAKILASRKRLNTKNQEREVHQFSLSGEYIASYKSLKEAERETGIHFSTIGNVCRRERGGKSAGGYLWSYSKDDIPMYNPYPNNHKVVYRYAPNGDYIDEWYSVADAERTFITTNISRCANMKKKCKAGGYWWRYYKVDNIFKGAE